MLHGDGAAPWRRSRGSGRTIGMLIAPPPAAGCHALDAVGSHVAGREDTWNAGLEREGRAGERPGSGVYVGARQCQPVAVALSASSDVLRKAPSTGARSPRSRLPSRTKHSRTHGTRCPFDGRTAGGMNHRSGRRLHAAEQEVWRLVCGRRDARRGYSLRRLCRPTGAAQVSSNQIVLPSGVDVIAQRSARSPTMWSPRPVLSAADGLGRSGTRFWSVSWTSTCRVASR